MKKCEHGLTTKECFVCASAKYGAAQPEPAAPTVKTYADSFCDLHCADEHAPGCVRAEPVAWMNPASQSMVGKDDGTGTAFHIITTSKATGSHTIPLYTRPPRTALTVESIREEIDAAGLDWHNGWTVDDDSVNRYLLLCRAIEAAHGITASEGAA